MDAGLAEARRSFGDRLQAAFAIGSLAHGGFAPAASDVDLALILSELGPDDAAIVEDIRTRIRGASASALAGRLSIFWSSWEHLGAGSGVGRFPLSDRQDLAEAGVRLLGEDRRGVISLPAGEQMRAALVVEGAEFMLDKLATPERNRRLRDPEALVRLGCREVTKAVLFPARFLLTASSGRTAGNEEAARHVAERVGGAAGALAAAAYGWRCAGELAEDAVTLLRDGLVPLYGQMIATYAEVLSASGRSDLAAKLQAWSGELQN